MLANKPVFSFIDIISRMIIKQTVLSLNPSFQLLDNIHEILLYLQLWSEGSRTDIKYKITKNIKKVLFWSIVLLDRWSIVVIHYAQHHHASTN